MVPFVTISEIHRRTLRLLPARISGFSCAISQEWVMNSVSQDMFNRLYPGNSVATICPSGMILSPMAWQCLVATPPQLYGIPCAPVHEHYLYKYVHPEVSVSLAGGTPDFTSHHPKWGNIKPCPSSVETRPLARASMSFKQGGMGLIRE